MNDAFDEVDCIDRLMSHDKANSPLSRVNVLTSSGTAGDALDDAFFVLGLEYSRAYVNRLHGTEAMFFLPASARLKSERASAGWTVVRQGAPQ